VGQVQLRYEKSFESFESFSKLALSIIASRRLLIEQAKSIKNGEKNEDLCMITQY
jgi:hypothetical protein